MAKWLRGQALESEYLDLNPNSPPPHDAQCPHLVVSMQ